MNIRKRLSSRIFGTHLALPWQDHRKAAGLRRRRVRRTEKCPSTGTRVRRWRRGRQKGFGGDTPRKTRALKEMTALNRDNVIPCEVENILHLGRELELVLARRWSSLHAHGAARARHRIVPLDRTSFAAGASASLGDGLGIRKRDRDWPAAKLYSRTALVSRRGYAATKRS